MTQTSTVRRAAAAPGQGSTAGPPGTSVLPAGNRQTAHALAWLAGLLRGSPGRLRVAAAAGALACLTFALLGASALQSRADALEAARRDTAQLVRVQEIASDLAKADAAVTNGFLAGGAEPAALTAQYDEAVASASRRLVDAAAAAPQDRAALSQADALLTDYSRQVAHARDANRQNLPLGSGYLVLASQNLLREQIDPLLDATVTSTEQRVDDAFARADRATVWLALGALLALAVLVGASVWLARRTRRTFNLGLVAATAALLVAIAAATVVMASAGATADDVRSSSYPQVQGLAAARNAAYRAKGLESLTLVKQGGGGQYEEAWQQERDAIEKGLAGADRAGSPTASTLRDEQLAQWTATHQEIRGLDDGGDWPAAVAIATGSAQDASGQERSSNADFEKLVDGIDGLLGEQAQDVSDALGRPWAGLQAVGWTVLVLGVLAALAAVAGFAQRLGEYR